MTTLWSETRTLDLFLNGKLSVEERLLVEARLINESELSRDLDFQKKTIRLIKMNARRKLKSELEAIHCEVFADDLKKGFQQRILKLFHS